MLTSEILFLAKSAKSEVAVLSTKDKNEALLNMADALMDNSEQIINANKVDIEKARGTVSEVMLDRLTLNADRIKGMADGIKEVAALPDCVGEVISQNERKGMLIKKVSVPLGVVAIIYESRPNVTSDAAALCIKSGNACVLRGGKEAINSNMAIVKALKEGLKKSNITPDAIGLVEDTTRQSANELMSAVGFVDLLVPRGGAGLIKACVDNAKVPCIQTGTGICHIYVDKYADLDMALEIIKNAKTSRPSVCNAAEVCLVQRDIAKQFLPRLQETLFGVELRLCEESAKIITDTLAGENDFDTEFLDYILAVKIVDDVKEAITHIALHSTGHSEAIVTENTDNADYFTASVDSAAVYVNASTRFTDGGEFGLGCEMGISTQKLHARGPMGLRELNTYKYVIIGNGQVR